MDVFKLLGKIVLEGMEEAARGLDGLSERGESTESRLTGAFKKIGGAVMAYFATDRIIEFGKACVEMSATVAAEESAFEQIMGSYADSATEKMGEIADATGMVDSRLTPYMTSMTAKFKGLGYGIDEATSYAQDGLLLAADAAAFWDKSLDESMSHLNSFVNGSYEGGEAIGLFANDTQMAAYAVEKGLVSQTKEWSALEEKIKQATRLEYAQNMMKQSGAMGQAAKESGQYANQMANLSEKWRQVKADIGEPILENVVLPAVSKLSDFVSNTLAPGVETAAEYFENKFLPAATAVAEYLEDKFIVIFGNVKDIIENNTDKIAALEDAIEIIGDFGEYMLDFIEWMTGSSEGAEKFRVAIEAGTVAFITHNAIISIGTKAVNAYRKAQMLLNATNPYGWVALAVSGLVALEISLRNATPETEKITKKFSELSKQEQKLKDDVELLSDELAENQKAFRDNVSSVKNQYDEYDKLVARLDVVADKSGNVKEGYEQEAQYITTELSEALGYEIEIRDGQIQKIDEVKQKVTELIDEKRKEALADVATERYTQAMKDQSEAYDKMIKARSDLQQNTSELAIAEQQYINISNMNEDDMYKIYGAESDRMTLLTDLEAKINGLKVKQDELTTTYDNASYTYQKANGELESYQDILSAMIDGTVEDVEEALGKMQQGFIDAEHGNEKSLRRQADDMKQMVKQAEQAFADGQISEEYLNELRQMETYSTIELNRCLAAIYGKDAEFAVAGRGNADAWGNNFLDGLHSNFGKIINTVESYVSYISGLGGSSSAYVNSPSDAALVIEKLNLAGHAKGGIVTREHIARVGEDGAEAIIPLEHNTEWIDKVASRMSGNTSNSVIAAKLDELILLMKNQKIYLDGRTLVGGIANEMDKKLGSMARQKRRS